MHSQDALDKMRDWELDRLRAKLQAAEAEERKRVLAALIAWVSNGCGSFRTLLEHLEMDYATAYTEGWMGFTNAICDHETRITGGTPDEI